MEGVLWSYIQATLAILMQWTARSNWDFKNGYRNQGVFAAANAVILGYALLAFVGFRNAVGDLFRSNA